MLRWLSGWLPIRGLPLESIREILIPFVFRVPRDSVSVLVVQGFGYEWTFADMVRGRLGVNGRRWVLTWPAGPESARTGRLTRYVESCRGAVIAILSSFRLGYPMNTHWIRWINVLLGIWTFISPRVYGYTVSQGRFTNSLCVGVIVFFAALRNAMAAPHTGHPLTTHT